MKRCRNLMLSLLALALMIGCAGLKNPDQPNNAVLIFGYIDMDDAPTNADYVTIRQYKPKPKDNKPYWTATGQDGLFWYSNLVPGSYQMVAFGGHSCWKNASYNYNMQDFDKNESALAMEKPGVYFMGSFKYMHVGSFFSNKFDVQKTSTPTEKEVLQLLLPYSKGTYWEPLIQKRIGALK